MSDVPRRLKPASVERDDFRGSVALDEIEGGRKLYQFLDLDQEEWAILAMELSGGAGEPSGVRVHVAPRELTADEMIAAGEVSVIELSFDEPGLAIMLLTDYFARWQMTVTRGFLEHHHIKVDAAGFD